MPLDWGKLAAELRFYFGEDLGSLTLPQLRDRQAFLYSDQGGVDSGNSSQRLAQAATMMMSKTGRKEMGLAELMGVM